MEINIFILVIALFAALIVGYWARKYIEKKYPDRAAALDTVVKQYGDKAESAIKDWRVGRGK